jgi:hypothetical protein
MDEADAEPPGDEPRVQEGPIGPVGRRRLRLMPRHHVIGKVLERVGILARRVVLAP